MASTAARKVLVVAGLGKGSGTGASVARQFAKAGYSLALIARGSDTVNSLAKEISSAGGEATGFPVATYDPSDLSKAWDAIRSKYSAPNYRIDTAVLNVGQFLWKPFLDITPEEVKDSLSVVQAAFAFSRGAIQTFKENDILEPAGKRGTLITTGATAALRGNAGTAAFAAQKNAIRALSQSLNKEFGKENIHVAHVVMDGNILTERMSSYNPEAVNNPNARLDPNSIASAYLYLANQDRSAWTWELDLRPAHEKW